MLYVTTRDKHDAFTAHRALEENRSADGGLYLPFRAPSFSQNELEALLNKPFHDCAAEILNVLFNTKITGWDLDFSIGNYPPQLKSVGHRIIMAESWHNPDQNYDWLVRRVSSVLCGRESTQPGNWLRIAVRIAVLFGIFAELKRAGIDQPMDISVVSGDFSAPISAFYAKQWGLPIGNIVCCCNENNSLWDLLCHGQMRTDGVSIPTAAPEADVSLPADLERLIFEGGGVAEVQRYLESCRQGRMYCVSEEMLAKLRRGLYVSVVSSQRMLDTIPSVYRTHSYLLSPYGALAYAGLMDYRAKSGGTHRCLVLTEKSPVCDRKTVSAALGISPDTLENYI